MDVLTETYVEKMKEKMLTIFKTIQKGKFIIQSEFWDIGRRGDDTPVDKDVVIKYSLPNMYKIHIHMNDNVLIFPEIYIKCDEYPDLNSNMSIRKKVIEKINSRTKQFNFRISIKPSFFSFVNGKYVDNLK